MTTNNYQWLPMTTNNYQLTPLTTNDYQWLPMTINDYQWLPMTTNGLHLKSGTLCQLGNKIILFYMVDLTRPLACVQDDPWIPHRVLWVRFLNLTPQSESGKRKLTQSDAYKVSSSLSISSSFSLIQGSDNCDEHATCANTVGGFTCTCDAGYDGAGTTGTCLNVDECATPNICPANSNCVDNDGSYTCDCVFGYKKELGSCVNINECALGHNCAQVGD